MKTEKISISRHVVQEIQRPGFKPLHLCMGFSPLPPATCPLSSSLTSTHSAKESGGKYSTNATKPKSIDCCYTPPHIIDLIIRVLGENTLPKISPSTTEQCNNQPLQEGLLFNIASSDNNQVLGESLLTEISPSTTEPTNDQIQEESLLQIISPQTQASNNNQVLGESSLPLNSPSTRKHGEGSGNLSWGYANANSTKKKPIKQLYFEWEYGGMRGKTYVRTHLKERIIALNQAKVPVAEILELLAYNPKVKRVLGLAR